MTRNLFSRQKVIQLLSQLKSMRPEYPPELFAAQRRTFLFVAAQLAEKRSNEASMGEQWIFSLIQEPVSTIVKALIVILFGFLLAFLAYSIASGSADLGWLLEFLLR